MKGSSSYSRKNKKPHKYSSLYHEWRAARDSGNSSLAAKLSAQHSERYLGVSFKAVSKGEGEL